MSKMAKEFTEISQVRLGEINEKQVVGYGTDLPVSAQHFAAERDLAIVVDIFEKDMDIRRQQALGAFVWDRMGRHGSSGQRQGAVKGFFVVGNGKHDVWGNGGLSGCENIALCQGAESGRGRVEDAGGIQRGSFQYKSGEHGDGEYGRGGGD